MNSTPACLSGTTATTIHFENGEQVYPCHAVSDYDHQNCPHDAGLWLCEEGFAICRACGKDFDLTNL